MYLCTLVNEESGNGESTDSEVTSLLSYTMFVYYESTKRDLNKRLIFDSRCDTRLKGKVEGCTRLTYTMWI